MTFLELQQAVYGDTGYASSPASDVSTRVKRWINEAHRTALRLPALSELRRGALSLASVANQPVYGVPAAFDRIDSVVEQGNNVRLLQINRDTFRMLDPGERQFGVPYKWVPEGYQPVVFQPSSTGLWAASSNAGDTTQTVFIQGVTADGNVQAIKSATLTGTARVAIDSTTTTYVKVLLFNISATAVGTVTLYDAATLGNALAVIPIGAKSIQYYGIRLWPTPTSVLTYVIDGEVAIQDLVDPTDVPLLPPSWHDLLQAFATMREYERTADERYPMAQQKWERGIQLLKSYVQFPEDYRPVAGQFYESIRRNNVGSWFPADHSWP